MPETGRERTGREFRGPRCSWVYTSQALRDQLSLSPLSLPALHAPHRSARSPLLPFRSLSLRRKIFRCAPTEKKCGDLLSVEKASAAASTASATSSSTPRVSRPITTLFLLTVVSFVPPFRHCVTANNHHHHYRRHHRRHHHPSGSGAPPPLPTSRLLPAATVSSPRPLSLAPSMGFSLSLSLLPFEYRSTTITITRRTAVGRSGDH